MPAVPRISIPEPLRGAETGTFTENTMSVRMPDIARRVMEERSWSGETIAGLQALIDTMPHGRIRPLQDDGAPDTSAWERYMLPYLGQSWLEAPWFAAENYFFRRILEATGYYQPGPGQGVDPYASLKHREMAVIPDALRPLCTQLDELRTHPDRQQVLGAFAELLRVAVWGNQADLSLWWSEEHKRPTRPEVDRQEEYLLDDYSTQASRYLASLTKQPVRVDFILDNGGLELAYDLVMGDFLLSSGIAQAIFFHPRPHPTYVSDVTARDVLGSIEFLATATDPGVRNLAQRWQSYLSEQLVHIRPDYFWISPLSGWEMPSVLRQELAKSDLIISKGDMNYRRWLGDRHWPFTTSLQDVLSYLPAPLLALRVLKAETIIGLQPGQPEEMNQKDPQWLFNGRYGIIQFINP